jgi:hypothetical protein
MTHMEPFGAHVRIEFLAPSRGLLGARTAILTLSQGEAIFSHVFDRWKPDQGRIPRRTNGVLVSDRAGDAVPYGLFGLADRGTFFVAPGEPVYEGMVVGENNKDSDLPVNVCREKKLTNMRAAGRDDNVKLSPPHVMSLEEALAYIEDDELLEVDAVIAPIGGGGLLAGVGAALRELRPEAKIYAAEPETAAPLARSLRAGQPSTFAEWTPSFVDGAGGRSVLETMWPLLLPLVEASIIVPSRNVLNS